MIGIRPSEAKKLSLWEFGEIMNFWADAHAQASGGMSEDEKDEVWDWLQAKQDVPLKLSRRRKLNGN
jgi:hypothetical protein